MTPAARLGAHHFPALVPDFVRVVHYFSSFFVDDANALHHALAPLQQVLPVVGQPLRHFPCVPAIPAAFLIAGGQGVSYSNSGSSRDPNPYFVIVHRSSPPLPF